MSEILRLVVRLSVREVRSVVEIECDVQVVGNLEVSLNCDVQSVSFKISSDVLSNSVGLRSRVVLEYCQSVVSVKPDVFFSVNVT